MIDTHCHLYWENLPEIWKILESAKNAWVKKFLNVWTDNETSKKAFLQAEKNPEIFFSAWIHPAWSQKLKIDWDEIEDFLKHEKCLAVWECGFDFYHDPFDEKFQEKIFIKQKELAKKYDLPLIIHTRNAWNKILKFLEKWDKFVIHCFSENEVFAKKVLEKWWMISVWWILTFPAAQQLREVVEKFPLENLMLETDAPFLAPQKHRWQVNQPSYMKEVAVKISEIKWISLDEVVKKTSENAEKFFGFK